MESKEFLKLMDTYQIKAGVLRESLIREIWPEALNDIHKHLTLLEQQIVALKAMKFKIEENSK